METIEGRPTESYVVEGAKLKCSLGTTNSKLMMPTGHGVYIKGKKQANILDMKPMYNILPFCNCMKSAPPLPCTPLVAMPWLNGKLDVIIGSSGALIDKSTVVCPFGGIISIVDDGQ